MPFWPTSRQRKSMTRRPLSPRCSASHSGLTSGPNVRGPRELTAKPLSSWGITSRVHNPRVVAEMDCVGLQLVDPMQGFQPRSMVGRLPIPLLQVRGSWVLVDLRRVGGVADHDGVAVTGVDQDALMADRVARRGQD